MGDRLLSDRLTGFGFLASKEVKAAGIGNLGLQDRELISIIQIMVFCNPRVPERQALRWVQRYIGAFGGDPTKVTM